MASPREDMSDSSPHSTCAHKTTPLCREGAFDKVNSLLKSIDPHHEELTSANILDYYDKLMQTILFMHNNLLTQDEIKIGRNEQAEIILSDGERVEFREEENDHGERIFIRDLSEYSDLVQLILDWWRFDVGNIRWSLALYLGDFEFPRDYVVPKEGEDLDEKYTYVWYDGIISYRLRVPADDSDEEDTKLLMRLVKLVRSLWRKREEAENS